MTTPFQYLAGGLMAGVLLALSAVPAAAEDRLTLRADEPDVPFAARRLTNARRTIVTTMKNEGPFMLEWIAYNRVIGFTG